MTPEGGAVARPAGDLPLSQLETLRSGLRIMALRALGSDDLADEVVQETLARAVEALRENRLADPARLGGFVAGIARHVIADVHRRRGRVDPLDSHPATADPRPDSLALLISAEERGMVRAALGAVSPEDREILRLAFYEGLRAPEIAARLGRRADWVRKRKSRALDRVRAALTSAPPVTERPPVRLGE